MSGEDDRPDLGRLTEEQVQRVALLLSQAGQSSC